MQRHCRLACNTTCLLTAGIFTKDCHTYGKQAMRGVAKDESVLGVKRGASLPDYFYIAKPGLQGSLHVFMAPLLDECRFPPAYVHSAVHDTISSVNYKADRRLL